MIYADVDRSKNDVSVSKVTARRINNPWITTNRDGELFFYFKEVTSTEHKRNIRKYF